MRIEDILTIEGDSLDMLKMIPNESISLILTDPPYHATKKKNITGDTNFQHDNSYLEWLGRYFTEWRRIIKKNGSVYCFCDSSMSARIEVLLSDNFNILSHIVWTKPNAPGYDGWKGKMKKEALRQWYPLSERIIFAEPKANGNLFGVSFANILRENRKQAELSQHELAEMIGAYGKVNHGGAVSNWEAGRNTPSEEQYQKIVDAFIRTGKVVSMPNYTDIIRVFRIDKTKPYTDIWNFETVRQYKGKHPAEKPIDLLKHIIEASSNVGDIVLDCFAGSGNTGIAAQQLGRNSILMEMDKKWVEKIRNNILHRDEKRSLLNLL